MQPISRQTDRARRHNRRSMPALYSQLSLLWTLVPVLSVLAVSQVGCDPAIAEPEWPSQGQLLAQIDLATQSPDPATRSEVLRLMSVSGVSALDDRVRAGLEDETPIVRAAALESLLQTHPEEARQLVHRWVQSSSDEQRRQGLELALRHDDLGLRNEALALALQHENNEFRSFALRRVVSDPGAVDLPGDVLIDALRADDATVVGSILMRLPADDRATALHSVHQRMRSDDEGDHQVGLQTLGLVDSVSAWSYLRWVREYGEPAESELAMLALARLGDSTTVPALREMVFTGRAGQTPAAIRALAGLEAEHAEALILEHREATRPEVRTAALFALLDRDASASLILPFLSDPDPDIARLGAQALQHSGGRDLSRRLCAELRITNDPGSLLRLIWQLGDEAAEAIRGCSAQLEGLLGHSDSSVRGLAANLLFRLPDVSAPAPTDILQMPVEVLYAYLEVSLGSQPQRHLELYRDLLRHELLPVRTAAALGLLIVSESASAVD